MTIPWLAWVPQEKTKGLKGKDRERSTWRLSGLSTSSKTKYQNKRFLFTVEIYDRTLRDYHGKEPGWTNISGRSMLWTGPLSVFSLSMTTTRRSSTCSCHCISISIFTPPSCLLHQFRLHFHTTWCSTHTSVASQRVILRQTTDDNNHHTSKPIYDSSQNTNDNNDC